MHNKETKQSPKNEAPDWRTLRLLLVLRAARQAEEQKKGVKNA